jgi:hypothetical protein
MKLYNIEAEWHMKLKNRHGEFFGHRVKVLVLDDDLGFFINGMVVCPPETSKTGGWEVYTPKAGNARIIEFNGKKSKLWPEIKDACIDAAKEYLRSEKLDALEEVEQFERLSKEEFDKKMTDDLRRAGF